MGASQAAQWQSIHLPMQEMQETWVWPLGREDALKEGVAAHSSIRACKVPPTEAPGRLQSMGSQRVSWTRLSDRPHVQVILRLCTYVAFAHMQVQDKLDVEFLGRSLEKSFFKNSFCIIKGIYMYRKITFESVHKNTKHVSIPSQDIQLLSLQLTTMNTLLQRIFCA